MNIAESRWLQALAGEYVLGTLSGRARRRFERAMTDPRVAAAVHAWEARLSGLAATVPPVMPRDTTWAAIEARLGLGSRARRAPRSRSPWLRLALAAALAAVAITVGVRLWVEAGDSTPVATVATTDGQPLWRINVSRDGTRLRVATVGAVEALSERDYELWALPEGGSPVSLGLLPAKGRLSRRLAPAQFLALSHARQVAVSIEQRGGSPTGAPVGPIIHVMPVLGVISAPDAGRSVGG